MYVDVHSSGVTSVPWLCFDTHSISPVNDDGSLKQIMFYIHYIHLCICFFVKGNVLFDI
jgi:hypothetical protein